MPVEETKEAARIAVEASGGFSSIWGWSMGVIGTGIMAVFGHITGRIKKLEENTIKKEHFKAHEKEESEKFDTLFDKHDKTFEKVSSIQSSVARIEGQLLRKDK